MPGWRWTTFAPRLSFFFNAHNDFFEEVAKFRAARQLWAQHHARRALGRRNARALMLRFHAQTGGSTLTAQQAANNIVRVTVQAFSAVLGGAAEPAHQWLRRGAGPADRAQRHDRPAHAADPGVRGRRAETTDPLAGSYYIEALTDELATLARELITEIDELGGAVAAVESGWVQEQIEQAAFTHHQRVQSGDEVIVGVNRWTTDAEEEIELQRIDPASEQRQCARTADVRAGRDAAAVESALSAVREAAVAQDNLLPPMREALRAYATVGEVCTELRREWGTYDSSRTRP